MSFSRNLWGAKKKRSGDQTAAEVKRKRVPLSAGGAFYKEAGDQADEAEGSDFDEAACLGGALFCGCGF
jgi:hypothetical protein